MKKITTLKFVIALSICAFMITPIVRAQATPQPPCLFYGNVTVDGLPAKDGLTVMAMISGTTLNWTTQTANGTYGWGAMGSSQFMIPSNSPNSTQIDGGVTGDEIIFYVNGTETSQTAAFDSGSAVRLDLSIGSGTGLEQSALTESLNCSTAYVGYSVGISGRLVYPDHTGISQAYLLAEYSVPGNATWIPITSFNTTGTGNYYAEWTPNAAGVYAIKVSWAGNTNVAGAEATVNLAITSTQDKYVFSVISNSTISGLSYDSSGKVLDFTVSGPLGTMGYANITIPRDLISNIAQLTAHLDGDQILYTTTSANDSWTICINYLHSTHTVTVNLSPASPPFLATTLGTVTIIAMTIAIMIAMFTAYTRLSQRRKSRNYHGMHFRPRTKSD
ncbi:MAG TPA: hypothetical protein VK487_10135 [Candidatus Bathyarchaeia archaeon]|nr:hypothetical protein [Candidatus Bathyarchaeia archaeon]